MSEKFSDVTRNNQSIYAISLDKVVVSALFYACEGMGFQYENIEIILRYFMWRIPSIWKTRGKWAISIIKFLIIVKTRVRWLQTHSKPINIAFESWKTLWFVIKYVILKQTLLISKTFPSECCYQYISIFICLQGHRYVHWVNEWESWLFSRLSTKLYKEGSGNDY